MKGVSLEVSAKPQTTVAVAPQVVAQSELLGLDLAELDSRIEQELADNPALELEEDTPLEQPFLPRVPTFQHTEEKQAAVAENLPAPYTLQDDLWWQFRAVAPRRLHGVGQRLIAAVDDDGYLSADLFDLAAELAVAPGEIQEAIEYLQRLEPPGVAARSLQECLLLQVSRQRDEGQEVPAGAEEIIKACGGTLRADLVGQLAGKTKIKRARVEQILDYVRQNLYPFPGYSFIGPQQGAAEARGYTYPDVIIRQQGQWLKVELAVSRAHYLRLSQAYLHLERAHRELQGQQGVAQQQAGEQLQRAREFLRMLQRRGQVIKKVAEAVVEYQRQFIIHGPMYHRSLAKKQIAQLTGLHEASVCRATKGKYVMLPSGQIVGFETFFEVAVPVKRLIAQLVRNEPPQRPLSDRELARLLHERGHSLARRTVAKYRQALGIPGSAHRRRL